MLVKGHIESVSALEAKVSLGDKEFTLFWRDDQIDILLENYLDPDGFLLYEGPEGTQIPLDTPEDLEYQVKEDFGVSLENAYDLLREVAEKLRISDHVRWYVKTNHLDDTYPEWT